MSRTLAADEEPDAAQTVAGGLDVKPPGERYFRHPGDVVRVGLWATASVLLAVFVSVADATSEGVATDLGEITARVPDAMREFALVIAQVAGVLVPAFIIVTLVVKQRWRRLSILALASVLGAAGLLALQNLLDLPGRVPTAVSGDTWVASTRFPQLAYLAAVGAVATVGKPWLTRRWRRAVDIGLGTLVVVMAVAGTAGIAELALAISVGGTVGAALLLAFGAPNRRPPPAAVAAALTDAGLPVHELELERAEGGRAQLYRADLDGGGPLFVKVYSQDSRDADLLYRSYRSLLFRGPNDDWPSFSLSHDVEHEALLLTLARQAGVECPSMEQITTLPDDSVALVMDYRDGQPLDTVDGGQVDDALLDQVWSLATMLHRAHLAHRSLHTGNIIVEDGRPVVVDMSFAMPSAPTRLLSIDRAELIASLAALVGAERAVASAARVLDRDDLADAVPYLQPLGLSATTRAQMSKAALKDLRERIAEATGEEPPPLEQLVRVRPRTLLMVGTVTAAFYLILPELAEVGDSFRALRSADFRWLALCLVMSAITYVASAASLSGSVAGHMPFVPTTLSQVAGSFVNRVTPANVGGKALNVRFMQKAGIEPAAAVTGMGLGILVGAIIHVILLVVFFAWAGKSSEGAFEIPADSKILVAIVVVLALIGGVLATDWGRRLFRVHVVRYARQSWANLAGLARRPSKLIALFGGAFGVTMSYIIALAAAVAAFEGGVSFAEVGAVYLGSALIASAAPTPGGLGALEAALVAGFTGVGLESGVAVAAVLSYRLLTYWLPVLPGWASFHTLERRDLI